MKFIAIGLLGLAVLAGSATAASAQVMTVRQVLNVCPDIPGAKACPGVAEQFLSSRPGGAQTDAQIVNLVLALAEAAQQPGVSLPACLDTADGLRVLARGMTNQSQAAQVLDIADSLCENITTAALGDDDAGAGGGGGGGGAGPFESISPPGGGGGTPAGTPSATNGGETNGGETNGGETNGGETNGGETNGGETNGGSCAGNSEGNGQGNNCDNPNNSQNEKKK